MNQFEGCNWTVTENCSGYTLRELFVRIYSLCQSYGIEVIDVHSNSELNTNDKKFVSTVNKADYEGREAEYYRLTATDWVASDGLHPLAYGYSHGYLPIVREAIFGN